MGNAEGRDKKEGVPFSFLCPGGGKTESDVTERRLVERGSSLPCRVIAERGFDVSVYLLASWGSGRDGYKEERKKWDKR